MTASHLRLVPPPPPDLPPADPSQPEPASEAHAGRTAPADPAASRPAAEPDPATPPRLRSEPAPPDPLAHPQPRAEPPAPDPIAHPQRWPESAPPDPTAHHQLWPETAPPDPAAHHQLWPETAPLDPAPHPLPAESPPPDPASPALAELDLILARGAPHGDDDCLRLAALAPQVPGRQRAVTAALGRTASPVACIALRQLPPAVPGVLEALLRCFGGGVERFGKPGERDTSAPVIGDPTAPLLALDFRSSRARGFPDLVARAQAIAARCPAAEFAALDLDGRRHYRLTFAPGRCEPPALAAQLRAAHLDLVWLHGRLARLRGSRLWLGGWRFDADDPLGPAAQAALLQVWLRRAEQEPGA